MATLLLANINEHVYLGRKNQLYQMIKSQFFIGLCCIISTTVSSQVPKKRLPQNINVPTYSHIFPSLSGDGNQMIFLTNYTNSEGFETKYSYRTGTETWADPEPISSINRPGLDHIGSFCMSYDGNFVVFSSRRTPTIGNYDIWISEKNGNYWSQPQNPGKPLNSPANEGNPSLSPDGKSIYFMRCEKMENTSKSNCGLYVSHRISTTRWSEPEKLPDYINSGHETTPRILADNKTLVFASGRNGGKGKLDLYTSVLVNDTWSRPKQLSFINTVDNDEYISIPARGDIIYFSGTYRDQYNIYMAMIPEEFRPEKVLMLTGNISYNDGKKPSEDVLVQAYDLATGEIYTTTRLKQNDDSFTLFLPEGTSYDVSAFPQNGGHDYFSAIYDLDNMLISRKEELSILLSAIKSGISIPLSTIRFDNYTVNLSSESNIEIKRIIGFLKKNPGIKLEIGAFIDQVVNDSIPSNDLTEIIADTIFYELQKKKELTNEELVQGNTNVQEFDERVTDDSIEEESEEFSWNEDTVILEKEEPLDLQSFSSSEIEDEIEISPKDSLISIGFVLLEETDDHEMYYKVNYTYHNDRTQEQAEALVQKLIENGVPANLLEAKGYGDNWTKDHASEERNYWIELKILTK